MGVAWAHPVAPAGLVARLRLAFAVEHGPGGDVDDLIVERARQGDARAFAAIVEHYDHRLRGLAYRLLEDRDRMDDVLQEAYVRAFRALPGFRREARLGTWLFRITYNACMDDLRRRPGAVVVPLPGPDGPEPVAAGADPGELVLERTDLAAALSSLPHDQRAVVLLVDAWGYDYGQAAEVLGVRAGTIGSRLSRARAVLRRALEVSG